MNLNDELKKILKGDVMDDEETLVKYSHDASLFEVRPKVVVFPKDAKDVSNLVKWVEDHKSSDPTLSLTARAAGTCMSGGSINDSIIMDFTKYMNKMSAVKKISPRTIMPKFPGSHAVTITGEVAVMPGCFYRDFEEETLKQQLILPSYTASKSINAVGGMVGNNSGGELALRYGKTEDYIKELKVIFADGNEYVVRPMSRREMYTKIAEMTFEGQVYKKIFDLIQENKMTIETGKPQVSKNSAGYNIWNVVTHSTSSGQANGKNDEDMFDFCQLIVGSQGTLGIVTEITFYLVEKPALSKLAVVFLDDLTILGGLVKEITETNPLSVESYDDKTFGLAMKFFKEFVKAKGLWGTVKFGLSFIPEFFMVLSGGVPKIIILVEYDGEDETQIEKKCLDLKKKIAKYKCSVHITKNEKEANKYWDMRRDSFALLRKHSGSRRTAPFIDDVVVRPEFLPEFLPKLNDILDDYDDIIYTIAGHAGNGNFHIIPLMDFSTPKTAEEIMEISDRVYDVVMKYQGSITAEHNDGIVRSPYLPLMFGPVMYHIFEQIKQAFDPKGLFNPHKKVGVTKEYLKDHIVKEHPVTTHGS